MFVKLSAPNKPQIAFYLDFVFYIIKSLADYCLVNMTISRSRKVDLSYLYL